MDATYGDIRIIPFKTWELEPDPGPPIFPVWELTWPFAWGWLV